jgi:hypothetical protein
MGQMKKGESKIEKVPYHIFNMYHVISRLFRRKHAEETSHPAG